MTWTVAVAPTTSSTPSGSSSNSMRTGTRWGWRIHVQGALIFGSSCCDVLPSS